MSAEARVSSAIAAARAAFVGGRSSALVQALADETGLSPEGVELALDVSLEHDADATTIAAFVARARPRSSVAVLLAGNVFTAPLRAVAWALAQAPRVVVRTSRRARTFVEALHAAAPPDVFELRAPSDTPTSDLDALVEALPSGGALHAYGGRVAMDAARDAIRSRADVDLETHGPGFGVVVADAATLAARANDVALDVGLFDQRGCLSPRVALVLGDARGELLDVLDEAFTRFGERVPRGVLDAATRAELRRAIEVATFASDVRVGRHHALLDHGGASALPVPPSARALALVRVHDLAEAVERLRGHEASLASIGAPTALHHALGAAFPHARLADLGRMQRPPLDGPVDRRVVA